MQVNFKRGLKNEKQQHPYDLIFYYSYLYKVIRHGENPIEGGASRSLLIPILNIHLRIKNNINDSLKIVRTFHFKSQNILIKKYILFKEKVPAILPLTQGNISNQGKYLFLNQQLQYNRSID